MRGVSIRDAWAVVAAAVAVGTWVVMRWAPHTVLVSIPVAFVALTYAGWRAGFFPGQRRRR